jgi:multiple sugar transport system permease protein
MHSSRKFIIRIVEAVAVLIVMVYFLMPLWWLIISSFKPIPEIYRGNPFLPPLMPSFEIFETLFLKTEGGLWLFNSVSYSAVTAFIASLSSLAAGYSFSKFSFKGRSFLYGLVAFSLTLPVIIVAVPTFILVKKFRRIRYSHRVHRTIIIFFIWGIFNENIHRFQRLQRFIRRG